MKNINLPVSKMNSDAELTDRLKSLNIGMTAHEARKVVGILGRDPTVVELFIFDIEWSEHCSYKSSKRILQQYLPTQAGNVIMGPGEDAGIIEFVTVNGRSYAIVAAHESHNHPSQVLPVEGAATGIGGIVRDVDCMGATVCAVADGLRFGNPHGTNRARSQWIMNGAITGIWQYGNALGVPNLAGDIYFDDSFDDNCLVNVVSLGIVPTENIIRSQVPKAATESQYDLILVGKTTDASGFGGVTFASEIIDEDKEDRRIGAVQVHDPFLKNILITQKANKMVLDEAKALNIPIGMKDLGGGGLACASSEICSASGFGAEIHLDRVHISQPDLPPEVIACGETQERFILAVPVSFSERVLEIYNEIWNLPMEANGARASIIGKPLNDPVYRLFYHGNLVCDAPVHEITSGIQCARIGHPPKDLNSGIPVPPQKVENLGTALLKVLSSPNICSRYPVYKHYDTEVQGGAIIRPGEGDAGISAPLAISEQCGAGIALSVDGNPFIGEMDPYWGGAVAVAEAMRNVAATGAVPRALTDCLNYGNPEKPEAFWQFERGVQGIADAANNLWQFGTRKEPVPIISGNVSFYNESSLGKAIKPSPIIACIGIIEDISQGLTFNFKSPGNAIILLGKRRDEMAGSTLYRDVHQKPGPGLLTIDWEEERKDLHTVIRLIHRNVVASCHDISDGGFITSLAEMCMNRRVENAMIGAHIQMKSPELNWDHFLFCECGGFILEIQPKYLDQVIKFLEKQKTNFKLCGIVTNTGRLTIEINEEQQMDMPVEILKTTWMNGLEDFIS